MAWRRRIRFSVRARAAPPATEAWLCCPLLARRSDVLAAGERIDARTRRRGDGGEETVRYAPLLPEEDDPGCLRCGGAGVGVTIVVIIII